MSIFLDAFFLFFVDDEGLAVKSESSPDDIAFFGQKLNHEKLKFRQSSAKIRINSPRARSALIFVLSQSVRQNSKRL